MFACCCRFLLIIAFISLKLQAQPVIYFAAKSVGLEDGLSASNIRKIIRDKNNFYWISTQNGLNKFDGEKWIYFTAHEENSRRRLTGTDVFALYYKEGDDVIYAASDYAGIDVIDIRTNTISYTIPSGTLTSRPESKWIKNICIFNGRLLAVLPDAVVSYDMQRHQKLSEVSLSNYITAVDRSVFYENKWYLWHDADGMICYDPATGRVTALPFNSRVNGLFSYSMTVIGNEVWVNTNRGAFIYDPAAEKWKENIPAPGGAPSVQDKLTTAACAWENGILISDGKQLFLTDRQGVALAEVRLNKSPSALTGIMVFCNTGKDICFADDNNIYFVYDTSPAIKAIANDIKAGNYIKHAYGIKPRGDSMLLAAGEDGLSAINLNNNRSEQLISGKTVYSVYTDDKTLVSRDDGLWVSSNLKTWQPAAALYPELLPVAKDIYIGMEKWQEHKIVFASQLDFGVTIWDVAHHTLSPVNASTHPAFKDITVNSIVIKDSGSFFIVSENEVYRYEESSNSLKAVFSKDMLASAAKGVFMDLCETKSGYFLSGYGIGLIELDKQFRLQHVYADKEGLINNAVFEVYQINDSLLVTSSTKGLYVLNTVQKKVYPYSRKDGLQSNYFEESSGCRKGNKIYLGGIEGITEIDAERFRIPVRPLEVYISQLGINTGKNTLDTSLLGLNTFTVGSRYQSAKIQFSAINYSSSVLSYYYRIKGLENEWQNIHAQNFIDLIGVSPGRYTVEVYVMDQFGNRSNTASFTLYFKARWYQTLLFKLLVLLAVAGFFYGLYRFRVSQLKKVMAVRKKIASDLHDDLGGTLNSIKVYSHLAAGESNSEYVTRIMANTKEAVAGLKDLIWTLDDDKNAVKNLVEKIKAFALPVLAANNIGLQFTCPPSCEDIRLEKEEKRNLYLIIKEAITNTVKYAGCNEVNITLQGKGSRLEIRYSDNGIGFDPGKVQAGHGLKNLQERASATGYSMSFINDGGVVKGFVLQKK